MVLHTAHHIGSYHSNSPGHLRAPTLTLTESDRTQYTHLVLQSSHMAQVCMLTSLSILRSYHNHSHASSHPSLMTIKGAYCSVSPGTITTLVMPHHIPHLMTTRHVQWTSLHQNATQRQGLIHSRESEVKQHPFWREDMDRMEQHYLLEITQL